MWLFRIAVNLMKDEFRGAQGANARVSPLRRVGVNRLWVAPRSRGRIEREPCRCLETSRLPAAALQRAVLYLTTVEELSLNEVCEILAINKNTAKVNLSLARKRMREALAKRTSRNRSA